MKNPKNIEELIEVLKTLPGDTLIGGTLFYNLKFYSTGRCDVIPIYHPLDIIDASEFEKYMDYSLVTPHFLDSVKDRMERRLLRRKK